MAGFGSLLCRLVGRSGSALKKNAGSGSALKPMRIHNTRFSAFLLKTIIISFFQNNGERSAGNFEIDQQAD
jgi:hypothetical protein